MPDLQPIPRPTILLVEDEPTIAVTLCDDLADEGYAVTHTGSGSEALRLLAERDFAAVITDVNLPGASGLQVLRAARHRLPDAPVLVITALGAANAAAVAGDDHAQLLQKPFSNRRVLDWLRAECA